MRARTVFIILLILILLVALGPALVAVGSQEIAELAFGCQVDLNRVIPCVIAGKDYGQTFYDLGFAIWYSYLTIQRASCVLRSGQLRQLSSSSAGSATAGGRHPNLPFESC
jgi:hypothetical protein